MEDVMNFGDPDKLMSEEDLIIIKLNRPCSQPLPDKINVDSTAQLLSTNQEGFVSCKEFLSNQRISAALFAGCSAFDSSTTFEKAAELILKNVRALVVLHNRNLIYDLYSKSTCLRTLVLYHNLRMQIPQDPSWCPAKGSPSKLSKVVGSMPALGMDSLLIDAVLLGQAVWDSPTLTYIESPMHQFFSPTFPDGASRLANLDISTEKLILGVRVKTLNGTIHPRSDVTPSSLARAWRVCQNVQDLEVVTCSPDSLLKIAEFKGLRRLSVTAGFENCSFHRYILPLLKRFDLEALALTYFERVQLSLIASFCKDISSLSLDNCTVFDETAFGGLTKLRKLHLESSVMEERLSPLLLSCRNLEALQLDIVTIGMFIAIAPKLGLHKLERLVLNTDKPLWNPEKCGDELRRMLEGLPSLRYLATDCYGIRLFFETHAPHITLAWASCTICTTEFPRVDEMHNETWHALM
ncbi:unnamed protein product, partial [Ixodes hexagonus]